MSKKEKNIPEQVISDAEKTCVTETPAEEIITESEPMIVENLLEKMMEQHEEKFLRLAAEYDNFRKRTIKEKETVWQEAKSGVVTAFLPVYDNLERALKQETVDEAYKKGVEMTMVQLKEVLTKQGIIEIPALGESFDPNVHNAVMHIENPDLGENIIAEVFQTGFMLGEKVVRFAMVQVAN